jgi:release factor glutamine methyltransferase
MMTVGELVQSATERLQSAGIESARWDAERLVAHQINQPRLALYAHPERAVSIGLERAVLNTVDRRSRREPLQYLLGYQEFWGLSLQIGPEVLIPRPETEMLVEEAVGFLPRGFPHSIPVIADIGTGSGCLAVALAKEFPDARVFATDLSSGALAMASRNAGIHDVGDRIEFLQGNLWEPLVSRGLAGRIHLLVSNPPYIPSNDLNGLQPEIRDFEPRLALDGGADGLDVYRPLLAGCINLLAPKGGILLELGANQSGAVEKLARDAGLEVQRITRDGAGIPRVLVATRP